ncbi:MAG: hypothetical protein IKZ49_02745 [Alphaproteobacteria bacterium]|nr:hypothetical protein [Alphaproteobacteria bacterium]
MRILKYIPFMIMCMFANTAMAGWQYNGYYIKDGYYSDDGSRFIIGFNGGLSWGNASITNEVGSLQASYYMNSTTGVVISGTAYALLDSTQQAEYVDIGIGDVSELKAKKDFSKTAFAAGAYIGFTIPNHPQWRLQAGYDHIAETDYDRIPLFEGDISLTSGYSAHVYSSGVKSTITTDIISIMAVYDFFEGNTKPMNTIIPYVGIGAGYSMSKTTLKLTDIFGDLSQDADLINYGTLENGILVFDNPNGSDKYPTSNNIALLGTLGISYGINEYTYLDLNARVMYVPKISWQIANSDGTQHRDWFGAENMIYSNVMLGLRFEF